MARTDGTDCPTVTLCRPKSGKAVKRGACIRIGTPGAQEGGGGRQSFFLTIAEAEVIRGQLDAVLAQAKRERPLPEPPESGAAALRAA